MSVVKWQGWNRTYIVGCSILILASFLPYVNRDQTKLSLLDGTDGIFFLMFSVLIYIFIAFDREKVTAVLAIVMVYLGLYELAHTYSIMSKTGKAVSLEIGYYVLLAGTVMVLVGVAFYVYQNGLKDRIGKIFDRFFPAKEEKEEEKVNE